MKRTKSLVRGLSGAGLILLLIFTGNSCKKNLHAGDGGPGASTLARAINYQLIWADEFNGSSVNTGNWNIDVGNPGVNSEQEYYSASNVTETGGNLVLTARQQTVDGQPYTSGKIDTYGKFSTTYGRVEARIALPMVQGMWPAFWMLGTNINTAGWPQCGEIDIMEQVNTNNTILGTMHWYDNGATQYGSSTSTDNTPADFHIYAVEWNNQGINWYVDNNLYVSGNTSNNINNTGAFQNSFYILLNLAVGGTLSGPTVNNGALPTSMLVDYVHVYNITNSAPPPVGHTITLQGSNGLYVTSNNALPDSAMECNRTTAQAWEQFTVGDAGNGLITLQGSNGLYVTSNNGDSAMQCNRQTPQAWEQFRWITNSNGTISLQGDNGFYVTSNNGQPTMVCNRPQAQGWEDFTVNVIH
jgi:beta-glucanase (GH16 family)